MTRLTIKTRLMHAASLMLLMCILVTVCEKPIIDEKTGVEVPTEANVILRFTQFEQDAFSGAAAPLPSRGGAGVGSVTEKN